MATQPFRILFVSSGNAVRSQMAEGWARTLGPANLVVRSAGTRPRSLHPIATHVMQELGVDIASQRGKSVDGVKHERFDLLITLCDGAKAECPELPLVARAVHRAFDDPAFLEDPDEPDLESYRALRDEIRAFVLEVLPPG